MKEKLGNVSPGMLKHLEVFLGVQRAHAQREHAKALSSHHWLPQTLHEQVAKATAGFHAGRPSVTGSPSEDTSLLTKRDVPVPTSHLYPTIGQPLSCPCRDVTGHTQ